MSYQKTKQDQAVSILLRVVPVIILILFGLYFFTDLFSSDENEKNNNENQTNQINNEEADKTNSGEEAVSIEAVSDVIVQALESGDLETVADYVDAEHGLLFSPYVYVHKDAVVFEKEAVSTMLTSEEMFNWGDYDGKGTPIELTPAAYFDAFMDMAPYTHPDEVLIDDPQDRGNTLNNVSDVFPNARIIEYYNEGSEEYAGIDWASLILVYEEAADGHLTLLALVRDHWTI